MAFREVGVVEIKEVLRLRLLGKGYRKIAELTGLDRKTVRRYIEAAEIAGLQPDAEQTAIVDELIGQVVEAVRPVRPDGHGAMWALLDGERVWLKERVDADLKLTKIQDLFERRAGLLVPYATLHRFACEELGFGRRRTRCPSQTASRDPSSRSTSDGWACFTIRRAAGAVCATRSSSPPAIRGTSSSGSRSHRRLLR
jgi:hypothetical protein